MSQPFAWGGQSTGVSASASVLPVNTQGWFPLGWTGWISTWKARPAVNPSIQREGQFFGQPTAYIHPWPSSHLSGLWEQRRLDVKNLKGGFLKLWEMSRHKHSCLAVFLKDSNDRTQRGVLLLTPAGPAAVQYCGGSSCPSRWAAGAREMPRAPTSGSRPFPTRARQKARRYPTVTGRDWTNEFCARTTSDTVGDGEGYTEELHGGLMVTADVTRFTHSLGQLVLRQEEHSCLTGQVGGLDETTCVKYLLCAWSTSGDQHG